MLAVALSALLLAAAARAAPGNAAPDTFSRFLGDRGLLAAPAVQSPAPAAPSGPGLVERARERTSDMVVTAMNFLGVPYKRGGSSEETGFDCSGFTRHIFETSLGLLLPRRVDEQAKAPGLVSVKKDELQPGDLVFFNTLRRTFSHVGIYIGEGKFIHSPKSGSEVRVEEMGLAYWRKRFTGARRAEAIVVPAAASVPASAPATPLPAA